MRREQNQDGVVSATETLTTTASEPRRRTYRQNWPAYNAAQANEKHKFQQLLYDLCQNFTPVQRGRGRPPLPLSDVVSAF
jgi:hypothetical protein